MWGGGMKMKNEAESILQLEAEGNERLKAQKP
jgi:hypothetical protein